MPASPKSVFRVTLGGVVDLQKQSVGQEHDEGVAYINGTISGPAGEARTFRCLVKQVPGTGLSEKDNFEVQLDPEYRGPMDHQQLTDRATAHYKASLNSFFSLGDGSSVEGLSMGANETTFEFEAHFPGWSAW